MSRLTEVREALAATIVAGEIPGLTVYAYMPDVINAPAAVVMPGPGDFYTFKTSFDSSDVTLEVWLMVQRGQDQQSSNDLDDLMSEDGPSVYAAIAANHTLGGVVDDAEVTVARSWGTYSVGSLSYLAARLAVEIML